MEELEVVEVVDIEPDSLVNLKLLTHNSRLLEARHAKGLTQTQMAREIGISLPKLAHIENLRLVPSFGDQLTIAEYFDQEIDYFFPVVLMKAIEEGVFDHREAQLDESQIISLTEAQQLGASYDGETKLIEDISRHDLTKEIHNVLDKLEPREKAIIEERFGFHGESKTLRVVGTEFNVTTARIRQIEYKAIRTLRKPCNSRKLKYYLD